MTSYEIIERWKPAATKLLQESTDADYIEILCMMLEYDSLSGEGIRFDYPDYIDPKQIDPRLYAVIDYLTSPIGIKKYLRYRDYILSIGNPNPQWKRLSRWIVDHAQA